jgi:hypothetical protein
MQNTKKQTPEILRSCVSRCDLLYEWRRNGPRWKPAPIAVDGGHDGDDEDDSSDESEIPSVET